MRETERIKYTKQHIGEHKRDKQEVLPIKEKL